ncbi:DUF2871 domain-containing protein [Kitasatospora atroaurantiaca]|uniref:Uncharacterized protein DUF2871 n=1 Tax=Kitasatospora atroaurantiaca TaxID=285545 RepID=A0A561EXL6_9ACTN|nr:DUF2871 domain-containing protein [Kitasatospora atroaurantiaca]TWE20354.1 uncharacterized protein DUF2871 [Kitasatospora atroaurantiaca]
MRKSYYAAHVYMILGVISGLYYREITKSHHFEGDTQLSVVHTHLLALGMLGFLIVLALDKQFQLSGTRLFPYFFWFYNAGIAITVLMMLVRGTQTVLGNHVPEAVSWIAGLGHIILTVGLILLFVLLGKRLNEPAEPEPAEPESVNT